MGYVFRSGNIFGISGIGVFEPMLILKTTNGPFKADNILFLLIPRVMYPFLKSERHISRRRHCHLPSVSPPTRIHPIIIREERYETTLWGINVFTYPGIGWLHKLEVYYTKKRELNKMGIKLMLSELFALKVWRKIEKFALFCERISRLNMKRECFFEVVSNLSLKMSQSYTLILKKNWASLWIKFSIINFHKLIN